ncbi:hypothetical protein TH60_21345 [Pantoea ananatis]|jgi:D-glycero-D-manno-heptose 1,7-bisphosphate phosphatase|uniref:HAD-IIIA family hydrolase n=1 Tax=Pantoea ananas TaxID=553 RepID=UPI00235071D5|nr:HAD-IIIA family hydrolase [Pantoea ananatis]MDC7872040.1 hypothetical protein [Pantoea ananatis]
MTISLTHSILRGTAGKKFKGLLILDRDGVLIRDTGYPHRIQDVEISFSLINFLHEIRQRGYAFGFASNQGGIGLGLYSWKCYEALTSYLDALMLQHNAQPDFWLACAAHPDSVISCLKKEEHEWRKPRPGMLLHAMRSFGCQANNSLFVGDRDSDMLAAARAGIKGVKYTSWPENNALSDQKDDVFHQIKALIYR